MELAEFVAMETAYRALQDLDGAARRRALRWLNDALGVSDLLPHVESASTVIPLAQPAAAEASRQRGRRRTTKQAAAAAERPSTSTRTRGTTAAVPQARQPRRGRQRPAPAQKPTADRQRAYRRMPPAEDVLAAYRQTGTLTGLAEHFGVPRHTIQGWARRLRNEGHPIGRSA